VRDASLSPDGNGVASGDRKHLFFRQSAVSPGSD